MCAATPCSRHDADDHGDDLGFADGMESPWRPAYRFNTGTVYTYNTAAGTYVMTITAGPTEAGGIVHLQVERNPADPFEAGSYVCYAVTIPEAHLEQWLHDLDAWLVE